MRCKKHPGDLGSSVGVCASCLRERLFALIAAQAQIQQQQQIAQFSKAHHHNHQHSRAAAVIDESRKSDSNSQYLQPPPPPLIFPRSVSPYVARRKSDDSASWSNHNQHHNLRFYSTPQVGPSYIHPSSTATTAACKKQSRKFSLLSYIFRFRSDKLKSDATGCGDSIEPSSSSSPFWFSTIFSGGRRNQSRQFSMEYSGPVSGEPRQRLDRGMSPAEGADSDKDCENCDRSPSGSGYSSESSMAWKKTPVASVGMRRGKAGHTRNVSGLAFCLSPLVRASPKRNWKQKGGLPPELGLSGEFRAPARPHLSTAASFCANRSRKLADFGRANHNR
ncbi:KH domain-containing protein [Salix suchowensis]|nr:KH domain-containing protein [Salix suchowensis]